MQFTKKLEKELVFEIALFSAGIASIALLYGNNFLLTVILITTFLIGTVLWYKKHDAYFYVAGAIIGPTAEIICVYFGAWQYANPTFLGIPAWLPFAWGLWVMLIKRIAEIFVKIEMK